VLGAGFSVVLLVVVGFSVVVSGVGVGFSVLVVVGFSERISINFLLFDFN
jgi:hypothetical protein